MRTASRRPGPRGALPSIVIFLATIALVLPSGVAAASTTAPFPTPAASPSPTVSSTPPPILPPGPSPYLLPYPGGISYPVVQGNHGSFSHRGLEEYAWDFAMPVGSLVVAARAGRVSFLEQESNVGGPSFKEFGTKGNYVVVDHGDGTSAAYLHLLYHGALVARGDRVGQGQPLAYSGATGFALGPHLHIQIERTDRESWFSQSIPASFLDVTSDRGIPREGQSYTSGNQHAPPGVPLSRAAPPSSPGTVASPVAPVGSSAAPPSNDVRFLEDVSVPDGTPVFSGQTLTKRWRVANPGPDAWPNDTTLVKVGGDDFGAVAPLAVPRVPPGGVTELSVVVHAPAATGSDEGFWQLSDAAGNVFGDRLWIRVDVTGPPPTARAREVSAPGSMYFAETGHNVGGPFARYFTAHGGLALLGYPRTEAFAEHGLTVQYFQRARLDEHPELAGTPYEVQAALLGDVLTAAQQPFPKGQPFASGSTRRYFPQTGHGVQFAFLRYFDRHGGVDAFGYQISDELAAPGPSGSSVQYFQRARLEYHPDRAGTASEVQLGLLGDELLTQRGWLPVSSTRGTAAPEGPDTSLSSPSNLGDGSAPPAAAAGTDGGQPAAAPATTRADSGAGPRPETNGDSGASGGTSVGSGGVVVTVPGLRIRADHVETSAILAVAHRGDRLQATGKRSSGWVQVVVPGTSGDGWVDSSFTRSG